MMRRIRSVLLVLAAAWLVPGIAVASPAPASATGSAAALQKAVDGSWRSAADKARDRYRHPVQTLEFFGIQPDMTVVELAPGGGWFTAILAPYLREHGHLVEAPSPSPAFMAKMQANPRCSGISPA